MEDDSLSPSHIRAAVDALLSKHDIERAVEIVDKRVGSERKGSYQHRYWSAVQDEVYTLLEWGSREEPL